MPSEARFQFLAPRVLLDMLLVDTVANQFDRYRTESDITSYLASIGIDVTWYIDTASPRPGVADGVSQIADAAQTAAAVDGFPSVYEAAFFPSGTFLHLDMAELNLGIVRDSTLNSTNDFQIFGESFENVARIGPAQAAYWMTLDICPTGAFPPLGTVRTCE
jgi:acyl CoA:acetate/3-ketoacid CoA transferase